MISPLEAQLLIASQTELPPSLFSVSPRFFRSCSCVVSCSTNLSEMSCVFLSASRRIILHVWGAYILCVLAAEFLVTIYCISMRFPAMNSEQEFLDWSSPGTSFLLLRCVTPVSFIRYTTKIVICAECSCRGFDSLFVKLLAIPALSHDDYAAAQRVEIVASQKYSVVLEATCNLLFGIKSCSCRICIVHVAKDLKDQFWSNVIVHGLIPSRRGDIGFCWNVEVAPASGDLTNLPRWF
jgi:hypothetical protein